MPLYHFVHKETKELRKEWLKMSELDEWLAENTEWRQQLSAIGITDPHRMGRIKPDDNFRDLLREAKTKHKHNTIDTF